MATSKEFRRVVPVLTLLAVGLSAGVDAQGGELSIEGHGYSGRSWEYSGTNWAAVSVVDSNGEYVTGLTLDDFALTESIVPAEGGDPAEGPLDIDIAAQVSDWNDCGFWEASVGNVKLDVVFIVDGTYTMSGAMPAIRDEVHAFVDQLVAYHVDFQIAGINIGETPSGYSWAPFHNSQEMDEVREDIDFIFRSAGDWWSPTTAWDALLWTPWLGFRDDARRVAVIITDITPQTVYGTFWYTVSCTATTLSAVEALLTDTEAHTDMAVYYCLNPNDDVDYQYYCDESINPRAGDDASGLAALEDLGLATGLRATEGADPWPFEQETLVDRLQQDGLLPATPAARDKLDVLLRLGIPVGGIQRPPLVSRRLPGARRHRNRRSRPA